MRPFDPSLKTPLDHGPISDPIGCLHSICTFCGASSGRDPNLLRAAEQLGQAIAREGIRLVYGGGGEGLMGAVALAAARAGGEVVAVIPGFLASRIPMLSAPHEIVVVPDMHTRKKTMFDRADAFVALPGGIGTIEELTEVMTWHKLDQHRKPILIANFQDFWRPLLSLFEHLESAGFMRSNVLNGCSVADDPAAVLPTLYAAMGGVSSSRSATPPVSIGRLSSVASAVTA